MEKSNEQFTVYVSPLNNIYSFDNNYSDSDKQHETFFNMISDFKSSGGDVGENCGDLKGLSENLFLKEYLINRIQIVPYVFKEFLHFHQAKGTNLKLIAKNDKEIDIILFISQLLGLQFTQENIVHFDTLLETKYPFMVISEKVNDLYYLHSKNAELVSVFNFLIFNDTQDYLKLQEENISFLSKNSSDFYPDLIIESVRQANYYIEFIKEKLSHNNKSIQDIKKEFSINAVKVVYIFDSKSSAKNYRKRELAISTEKIKYTPFVTKKFGLDEKLSIYKDFQVLLQRCPYLYFSDPTYCKNLQSILSAHHQDKLLMHSMDVINTCFYRYNVHGFLREFVRDYQYDLKDYGIEVSVPFSFSFIVEDKTTAESIKISIKQQIKDLPNEINFPVIIKPDACTDHEMFLILNEDGLNNFINETNLEKRKKTRNFICQKFIAHGGLMFKNYYINNKSVTIIRPSLPDLEGETLKLKHFADGCFKFHNEFLYKKEDPTFWEGIDNSKGSGLESEGKINYEALDKVSKLFALGTNITLFGLDYLFDESSNTYYLLEINYFPSYRELGSKIAEEFAEHIIDRYTQFAKQNK